MATPLDKLGITLHEPVRFENNLCMQYAQTTQYFGTEYSFTDRGLDDQTEVSIDELAHQYRGELRPASARNAILFGLDFVHYVQPDEQANISLVHYEQDVADMHLLPEVLQRDAEKFAGLCEMTYNFISWHRHSINSQREHYYYVHNLALCTVMLAEYNRFRRHVNDLERQVTGGRLAPRMSDKDIWKGIFA